MHRTILPALVFFVALFLTSCYYDNLEELHPSLTEKCDTTGTVSYANDVVPILSQYCSINNASCHNSATFYPMDTYAGVHDQAVGAAGPSSCPGALVLSLTHSSCLAPVDFMPQGGGMLDTCLVHTIEAWVNRGALNN